MMLRTFVIGLLASAASSVDLSTTLQTDVFGEEALPIVHVNHEGDAVK